MRYWVIILLIFAGFISCTGNSAVSSKLSGADSLVINFYAPQSDSVVKTVYTAEEAAIRRLTEFVSAKETELYKCGYDGNLLFYEKGKLASDVAFKYSDPACRHFVLDIKGRLTSTKMSNEAADLLNSLYEGKNTY
jgi:hypothetical protein